VIGMPLSPRRIQRVPPQALYFDGVDDYVAFGDWWFPQPKFTIVVWFRHDNITTRWAARIIAKGDGYSLYGGVHLQQGTGGAWWWNNGTNRDSIDVGAPVQGVWYMKALVFDYPDVYSYVNGSLYASKTTSIIPTGAPGYQWYLAQRYAPASHERLQGAISSVLIYSRPLSSDEIAWNYSYPDNPVRNGLVLWLHWDSIDVNAGVWYDKSGYGNHGKIYGATLVQIIKPPRRVQSPARVLAAVR